MSGEIIWLLVFDIPLAVNARLSRQREVVATGLIGRLVVPFYLLGTTDFISTMNQKCLSDQQYFKLLLYFLTVCLLIIFKHEV